MVTQDGYIKTISKEFEEAASWDASMACMIAGGYALLNEKQKALDWLENAINHGFIHKLPPYI